MPYLEGGPRFWLFRQLDTLSCAQSRAKVIVSDSLKKTQSLPTRLILLLITMNAIPVAHATTRRYHHSTRRRVIFRDYSVRALLLSICVRNGIRIIVCSVRGYRRYFEMLGTCIPPKQQQDHRWRLLNTAKGMLVEYLRRCG